MLEILIGVVLILVSIFLIVAVLFQSSKNAHLSGAIAGSAETFFGKAKGKKIDTLLNKLTIIISIIFTVVVLAIYAIQPGKAKVTYDYAALKDYIAGVEDGSITITVTEEEDDHDHDHEDDEGTEGDKGDEGDKGNEGTEGGNEGTEGGNEGTEGGNEGTEGGNEGAEGGNEGAEGGNEGNEGTEGTEGDEA